MKPLSGVDAAFLHLETAQTPMHIASLCLFDVAHGDGRSFHAALARELSRRLHLAPVQVADQMQQADVGAARAGAEVDVENAQHGTV